MVPQHFVTRQIMHTKQTRQLHTLDNGALLRACCYQCYVIIYTRAHSYVRLCNTPGISIKSTNTYLCSITINIWFKYVNQTNTSPSIHYEQTESYLIAAKVN